MAHEKAKGQQAEKLFLGSLRASRAIKNILFNFLKFNFFTDNKARSRPRRPEDSDEQESVFSKESEKRSHRSNRHKSPGLFAILKLFCNFCILPTFS